VPLYEYQCARCGRFEIIRKFSDPPVVTCPTCGGEVQKLFSAPAIQFKGTGWYITDYARKSTGGEASGKGGGSKGGEGGSTSCGAKDGGGGKDAASSSSDSAGKSDAAPKPAPTGGSSKGSSGGGDSTS
jgi:putative FmdB family regulatory protein